MENDVLVSDSARKRRLAAMKLMINCKIFLKKYLKGSNLLGEKHIGEIILENLILKSLDLSFEPR